MPTAGAPALRGGLRLFRMRDCGLLPAHQRFLLEAHRLLAKGPRRSRGRPLGGALWASPAALSAVYPYLSAWPAKTASRWVSLDQPRNGGRRNRARTTPLGRMRVLQHDDRTNAARTATFCPTVTPRTGIPSQVARADIESALELFHPQHRCIETASLVGSDLHASIRIGTSPYYRSDREHLNTIDLMLAINQMACVLAQVGVGHQLFTALKGVSCTQLTDAVRGSRLRIVRHAAVIRHPLHRGEPFAARMTVRRAHKHRGTAFFRIDVDLNGQKLGTVTAAVMLGGIQ